MEAAPVQKASQPDASELSLPVPSRTRCLSGPGVDVALLAPAWLRYARAVARSLGTRCGLDGRLRGRRRLHLERSESTLARLFGKRLLRPSGPEGGDSEERGRPDFLSGLPFTSLHSCLEPFD